MLATAKGYYDGSQIVLDTPVHFQRGQEVIVTYSASTSDSIENNIDGIVNSLVGAIPNSGKTLDK